jgi:hypothetical protein
MRNRWPVSAGSAKDLFPIALWQRRVARTSTGRAPVATSVSHLAGASGVRMLDWVRYFDESELPRSSLLPRHVGPARRAAVEPPTAFMNGGARVMGHPCALQRIGITLWRSINGRHAQ